MTQGTTLYRSVALQGSTQLDLMIGVYDAIAENLRQGAAAVLAGEIAGRCKASDRAMLLLGHLESWLEFLDEPPLQDSLAGFYSYLRGQILHLQGASEPQAFIDLAFQVSQTRAAWQKRFAPPTRLPEPTPPAPLLPTSRMNWTA